MVRQLQPGILVNDRLDIPGDFVTPEQYQPDEPMRAADGSRVPWEVYQTLNGSWGYDRDNLDDKAADLLILMLVDTVAKDGNLLLNVGPTGRGPQRIDAGQAPDTTRMSAPPAGTLTLRLPVRRPEVAVPVIELFLR
ncbi:alpha-L-fucosidase [Streptomyces cavernae]|uniref:alpha-L-fucosidase n=1 Tax=Streptomyces cavernae TaxID=2259034 RepID=UPI002368B762|nr:alpha-L-fucosidase [Streptomyces cavernae]